MALAKLSSKSQVVLPAAIRKALNIHPGDHLEITSKDDAILIRKASPSATEALDACSSDIWEGYEDELKQARDQWT
jgi:AbrB family looped-hinge helix DNA binding protein